MKKQIQNAGLIIASCLGLFFAPGLYAEATSEPPEPLQVSAQVTLAGPIDRYSEAQLLASDTLVVDLRLAEEGTAEEEAQFAKAGIRYLHIPMGRELPSAEQVSSLKKIVSENTGKPILLHCSSGNRAGLLWAAHLIEEGVDVEEAVRRVSPIANRAPIQQAIRDYAAAVEK